MNLMMRNTSLLLLLVLGSALTTIASLQVLPTLAFVVVPSSSSSSSSTSSLQHDIIAPRIRTPQRQLIILSAATSTTDETEIETETEIIITTNPRLNGLAYELDEGTRKSHSMAQNTAFVEGFFKGISKKESYRDLLTSLYYVYKAMEIDVLDVNANAKAAATADSDDSTPVSCSSMINKLDDTSLRRLAGLEKDMEYFYGSNVWQNNIPKPTKATEAYVNRIQEISNDPSQQYLFIAHQYTRYLGDLFGGQMMGGMASRSMDLPLDGSGVQFYNFNDIKSTKEDFINAWYTKLNSLPLTKEQKQNIVNEANLVFDLNIDLLKELDGSPWSVLWTLTISSIKEKMDMYWNPMTNMK
jgi:heme oxygenase